jgi:hypothetical protein
MPKHMLKVRPPDNDDERVVRLLHRLKDHRNLLAEFDGWPNAFQHLARAAREHALDIDPMIPSTTMPKARAQAAIELKQGFGLMAVQLEDLGREIALAGAACWGASRKAERILDGTHDEQASESAPGRAHRRDRRLADQVQIEPRRVKLRRAAEKAEKSSTISNTLPRSGGRRDAIEMAEKGERVKAAQFCPVPPARSICGFRSGGRAII